jgi:hypothetical protein
MAKDAMRQLFAVDASHDALGNAEPLTAIFPKGMAPIVGLNDDGTRWLRPAHWGFVMPQLSKKIGKPIQPKAATSIGAMSSALLTEPNLTLLATPFECQHRYFPFCRDVLDSFSDRRCPKIHRVKRSTIPADHIFVLWVTTVGHGFHETHEARRAADIFRRRGPLAIQIQGIVNIWIGGPNVFYGDTMLPIVTEVVGVVEFCDAAIDQGCQAHILGVVNLMAPGRVLGAGFAIDALPDCELVEVIVLPRHDHLDEFMQDPQVCGQADFHAAPDAGLDVHELYAKSDDLGCHDNSSITAMRAGRLYL